MTTPDLMNINVDKIFEEYNISEIDQIHKNLQCEVEKKKEELRTMVGESYRDLLKAADTIVTMENTSIELAKDIGQINSSIRSLNEPETMTFKYETSNELNSNDQLLKYFSTVVQVKILTILPEIIWTNIEEEKYFQAAQMFLLAQHIHTGLNLNLTNNFVQYFPIAKKYWCIINPLSKTIKENALIALEKELLLKSRVIDCLLSITLLEESNIKSLLKYFIDCRVKSFASSLSLDGIGHKMIKERILSSLTVLYTSIILIYECFIEKINENNLLMEELSKFENDSSFSTISLLNFDDDFLIKMLPDIVAKFKPSFPISALLSEEIKISVLEWMESISSLIKDYLKNLLDLITSLKTIEDIKKQSLLIKKPKNWSDICEKLLSSSNLDFYNHLYQPIFNERIKYILYQSWDEINTEILNTTESLLLTSKTSKKEDLETLWFWRDDIDDIPKSLKEALNSDKKSKKLLMKFKGYNKDIVNICCTFDKNLEILLTDFSNLTDECNQMSEKTTSIDYLMETSEEKFYKLISNIKTINKGSQYENIIFLARLLMAITELCPNLKMCLSHSYDKNKYVNDKKNMERWNRICLLLEDESNCFWKQFCDLFLKKFPLHSYLGETVNYTTNLADFATWESKDITQNDENDKPIQSTIKVPSQPRISLQMYFFKIIESLNTYVPHALPSGIIQYLNKKITENILAVYQLYIGQDYIKNNQNAALQLYFDVKFYMFVFLEENDINSHDQFQKLANTFKSMVDPFDFELIYTELNLNIKKCRKRMYFSLGAILPENKRFIDNKCIKVSTEKDPNVLFLSSNGITTAWFPLLPVSFNSGTTISDTEKFQNVKTKKIEPKSSTAINTQNYASNVKSGAVAFFGAMSQDWFR